MKIDSFELINNGRGGMKVTGIDAMKKDNITVFAPIVKTYPVPLPSEITDSVDKLKKYMLEITNMFPAQYFTDYIYNGKITDKGDPNDKHYLHAKHVYENTHVKKVYLKRNGYILTGISESYENSRYFSISTPLIDVDDGYRNFDKLQKGVMYCFSLISDFIATRQFKTMNSRQFMIDFPDGGGVGIDKINTMSEDKLKEVMMRFLESKGILTIDMDEALQDKEPIPTDSIFIESGLSDEDVIIEDDEITED